MFTGTRLLLAGISAVLLAIGGFVLGQLYDNGVYRAVGIISTVALVLILISAVVLKYASRSQAGSEVMDSEMVARPIRAALLVGVGLALEAIAIFWILDGDIQSGIVLLLVAAIIFGIGLYLLTRYRIEELRSRRTRNRGIDSDSDLRNGGDDERRQK